jgi:hypothetical protein
MKRFIFFFALAGLAAVFQPSDVAASCTSTVYDEGEWGYYTNVTCVGEDWTCFTRWVYNPVTNTETMFEDGCYPTME